MRRISAVKGERAHEFHNPTRDLQTIVEDRLRGPITDAKITVAPMSGDELAIRGTRTGDVIELRGVERDWLVRTVASLAGSVVGIEP